jgi:hypothetical protein
MKGSELKGTTFLTLEDGKQYIFKYSMNSLVELEERYGEIEKISDQFKKINFKNVRHLIYAGLIDEKLVNGRVYLTEAYIGANFELDKMEDTVKIIEEAFTKSFGKAPQEENAIEEELPQAVQEAMEEAKKKD